MITWINDTTAPMPPATDAEVRAAQAALGIRLPADFLAVAQMCQGAEPVPHQVDLPNGFTVSVDHLLPVSASAGTDIIVARRFPVKDGLDPAIVPFAEDTGGDLFCFDDRRDPDRPSVAFWGAGFGLVPLAAGLYRPAYELTLRARSCGACRRSSTARAIAARPWPRRVISNARRY